ncbi:hypothetical protein CHELA20_50903 [Hyphomicrobiales bacterium]|nr:hypothetical protein CHELA20_50903 [Hyphomicrobiales bacterium]CAH1675457.1 hypothetical protein CHELA41_24111 [Hyphomicrobiales bacterium]
MDQREHPQIDIGRRRAPMKVGISPDGDALMVALALEEDRLGRPPSISQVQAIRRKFPGVSDAEAAIVIAAISADARHRCAPGADAWLHLMSLIEGDRDDGQPA